MQVQSLNNLRFFLALLVVFAHIFPWYEQAHLPVSLVCLKLVTYFNTIFRTGGETSPAVLLFITLSGYCIHRSFDGNLRHYIRQRFFRIIPLFVLGTILGASFFMLYRTTLLEGILQTHEIKPELLLLKLIGAHAFFESLYFVSYLGNEPLATVVVEIWLYVFYPIGLILLTRLGKWKLLVLLLAITMLGSFAVCYDENYRGWWNNGSFLGFLAYWWIGVLFHDTGFRNAIERLNPGLILSYFILTFVILNYAQNPVIIELRKLCLVFLGGLFIARLDIKARLQRSWSITKSSYSIYALHTPIIIACIHYEIRPEIAFVLVLLVAYLSYYLIERPLYFNGNRKTKQPSLLQYPS